MSAAPHTGEVGSQLTDFSPSRLGTISKCGRAFEYSYVHQLPQPYEKGNLLLGSAFHQGVQAWYELPDDGPARGFQTHGATVTRRGKHCCRTPKRNDGGRHLEGL